MNKFKRLEWLSSINYVNKFIINFFLEKGNNLIVIIMDEILLNLSTFHKVTNHDLTL